MKEESAKVEIKPGAPMERSVVMPSGAGASLEHLGGWMIAFCLAAGIIAAFVFGKRPTYSQFSGVGSEINTAMLWMIALSTAWSVAFSWAVVRLGTALTWLELIGKRQGIEAK